MTNHGKLLNESRVESINRLNFNRTSWLENYEERCWDGKTSLKDGAYLYKKGNVPFHFCFYKSKTNSKKLIISLTGGAFGKRRDSNGKYSRWTYTDHTDSSILCIDDPDCFIHDVDYAWFGGKDADGSPIWELTSRLIRLIISVTFEYDPTIIFYSSSSGGTASVLTSSTLDIPCTVVIINPQLLLPYSAKYKKLLQMNILHEYLFDKNYIIDIIKKHSENRYLYLGNLASKQDYYGHFRFMCKRLDIIPKYGINYPKKNLITWIYYAVTLKPHNAQDWGTFYPAIEYIVDNYDNIDKIPWNLLDMFNNMITEHHEAIKRTELQKITNGVNDTKQAKIYAEMGDFSYLEELIQKGKVALDSEIITLIDRYPGKSYKALCGLLDTVSDKKMIVRHIPPICSKINNGDHSLYDTLKNTIFRTKVTKNATECLFHFLIANHGPTSNNNDKFHDFKTMIYKIILDYMEYTNASEIISKWISETNDDEIKTALMLFQSTGKEHLVKAALEIIVYGEEKCHLTINAHSYYNRKTSVLSDCKLLIGIVESSLGNSIFSPSVVSSLLNYIIKKSLSEEITTNDDILDLFAHVPKNDTNTSIKQTALLIILKEFDRVCRANNIGYTLACGTLIGAFRHQGFIPWDDDADVYMLRDHFEKLKHVIANNNLIKLTEFTFIGNFSSRLGLRGVLGRWLFIDIFTFDYADGDSLDTVWDARNRLLEELTARVKEVVKGHTVDVNIPGVMSIYRELVPKSVKILDPNHTKKYIVLGIDNVTRHKHVYHYADFFPLKELIFEDSKLFAANNYEKILEINYGNVLLFSKDFMTVKHGVKDLDTKTIMIRIDELTRGKK